MASYHINGSGNPGLCRAVNKPCPFGGPDKHFASKVTALTEYEKEQAALGNSFPVLSSQNMKLFAQSDTYTDQFVAAETGDPKIIGLLLKNPNLHGEVLQFALNHTADESVRLKVEKDWRYRNPVRNE